MHISAKIIYKMKCACRGAFVLDANELRTTINIRDEYRTRISSYADSHNMKTPEVLRVLITRMIYVMSLLDDFGFIERPLIYQKEGFCYSSMHVSLSADEYSRCKDVIGCSRFCLSAIVGMAMLIFEELMSDDEKIIDSYPNKGYLKLKITRNKAPIFINSWGNTTTQHKPDP